MSAHDSVMVSYSLVRSILEYACVMFAALPQYLSDSLERIQKRVLVIIFPGSTYSEALIKLVYQPFKIVDQRLVTNSLRSLLRITWFTS